MREFKQKITREFWLEESNRIHNNKYDYSLVNFTEQTKTTDYVEIICPDHGKFKMKVFYHYKGQGCSHCGRIKKSIWKKHSFEEFVEKANGVHGQYTYHKETYGKTHDKIKITCKIHGDFWQTPHAHLCGQGCRSCGYISLRLSNEEFYNKYVNDYYGTISVIEHSSYENKYKFLCSEHGEQESSIIKQNPCLKCREKQRLESLIIKTRETLSKNIPNDYFLRTSNEKIEEESNISFICSKHGKGNSSIKYYSKYGCKRCYMDRLALEKQELGHPITYSTYTEDQLINVLDYSKYNISFLNEERRSVTIKCKIHNNNIHLDSLFSGSGCYLCKKETERVERAVGEAKRIERKEAEKEALRIQRETKKNNYLLEEKEKKINELKLRIINDGYEFLYIDKNKVYYKCSIHGEDNFPINQYNGCRYCRAEKSEDLINKISKTRYDLIKIFHNDLKRRKVTLNCNKHGHFDKYDWEISENLACFSCYLDDKRLGLEEFIAKHKERNEGYEYDYSQVVYKNKLQKVKIICPKHGPFKIRPTDLSRCRKCSLEEKTKVSKVEGKWLDLLGVHERQVIIYGASGRSYLADGIDKTTNTVYEFHGDYWHGNPKIYKPNDYNKVSQKTFGELYKRTIEREEDIRKAGYNLVVKWEYDWKNENK